MEDPRKLKVLSFLNERGTSDVRSISRGINDGVYAGTARLLNEMTQSGLILDTCYGRKFELEPETREKYFGKNQV